MQLMSWVMGRLGSRFTLFFEPHQRQVRHGALGRFLDQPLDLAVGLVEPDGRELVMPFCRQGELLDHLEQFERINSITFRGHAPRHNLRMEFNVHAVFYPQDEDICLLPAIYLEMRVNRADRFRDAPVAPRTPAKVKMFLRLSRPDTQITAVCDSDICGLDLAYQAALEPSEPCADLPDNYAATPDRVPVAERIVSLNPGCTISEDGHGLELELPVTEVGEGIKWRLVWGAHVAAPVLRRSPATERRGRLRYTRRWPDLDHVMQAAIANRDEWLARSRRFERLMDQTSLSQAQRHLCGLGFQTLLANSFWCDFDDGSDWFGHWSGADCMHGRIDAEYNAAPAYLAFWPSLLRKQLAQWSRFTVEHERSGGCYFPHDLGHGLNLGTPALDYPMPVETAADYLLLLHNYAHWTGDKSLAAEVIDLIEKLGAYLEWTDRDGSGFPSSGTSSTFVDAGPAVSVARKQVYLATKRLAGLQVAAEMLDRLGRPDAAAKFMTTIERALPRIERDAWHGDHYAVCVDRSTAGLWRPLTDKPLSDPEMPGWKAYSIHTSNAFLLPAMVAQPPLLDTTRLARDLLSAQRETLMPYGCGHASNEPMSIWVSQNMWRDFFMRYRHVPTNAGNMAQRYWDLQVVSNTHTQSLGFADSYVQSNQTFSPRGAVALGYLLAGPRLVVDRLAPGGQRIAVDPDRDWPQRWPLFPLADWNAGRIPVCVVGPDGKVTIESESEFVIIRGQESDASGLIG